jgi:proline iminopeptidase
MEALRQHLGVGRWTLLGGSWGVALSLAYGAAHPTAVRALILRGVCLMRRSEIDWAFRAGGGPDALSAEGTPGGAAALFPGAWATFTRALGVPSAGGADPVALAFQALSGGDAARRAAVASAWMRWGAAIGSPMPRAVQSWDGVRWAVQEHADATAGAAALAAAASAADAPPSEPPAAEAAAAPAATAAVISSPQEAQALLEAHYCLHDGFFPADAPLLSRLAPLRAARVPAVAVHGRADALCPVANAWALHTAWPAMELRVVGGAGHSMYEPGITHELLCASDAFRALPR